MLALIEGPIELDCLFSRGNAFFGTPVRKGAAGDSEVGEEARLEAEIADAACNLEAALAHLDGLCRIDDGVEHAEIGVTAAGRAEEAGRIGNCHASLDFADGVLRSAEPRQSHSLGVERLRGRAGRLKPSLRVGIAWYGLSAAERILRESCG